MSVPVYGDDYATDDGTCVRDYIHVGDLADAHLRALKDLLAGGLSGALNLANARGHSVMDVIETARRVCRRPIEYQVLPPRPGDPAVLIGSAERGRAHLGWRPARSDLQSQIADAWNWMCKNEARQNLGREAV